jgi:1,4-dihydroxy-2-naphthoate octaprenyltransferase
MFSKSSWLHLRIPFSYYLLPVYLFALAISPNFSESGIVWTFIIVHFLLYPASNGYNSYFDKDEKSIGGLKNPPKVTVGLYYLSIGFDVIALFLGFIFISLEFCTLLFLYGLISKAYSHPSIRLKKFPIVGWLTVSLFQGGFTLMMCYIGINHYSFSSVVQPTVLFAGVLATLQLLGTYPMTQIYQHEEDAKRGDHTLSLRLGTRGTFIFVGALFTLTSMGFFWYFVEFFTIQYSYAFFIALTPVIIFFSYWFVRSFTQPEFVNHKNTMRLNFISATCLNAFFIYLFLNNSNLLQFFE